MRWNTTNTALANRINNGNMFQETDILTSSTLNAIVSEIISISDLLQIINNLV
ncbi:MAG: hypothetical protein FWE36_01885 [Erysipelotrichales bacterium]|nr:hypothetical protein [Erysipelotrichales bacterium]